jgi:hypothetical protein
MFDDCRIETGDHLENNILHLLAALILSLPFLLSLRSLRSLGSLLSLRLPLWLLGLEHFLQSLGRDIDILDINISRILEGIDLSDSSLDLLVELMRSYTLQDAVILISEDDIALGVELQDEVVGKRIRAEGYDHHPLHTHLSHAIHSLRPQELPEAHGEPRRDGLLIRLLLGQMKPHSILHQQLMLLLRFGNLEDVRRRGQIVDVGDAALGRKYRKPIRHCNSATMAATSREVNRTFVFTFYALGYYIGL